MNISKISVFVFCWGALLLQTFGSKAVVQDNEDSSTTDAVQSTSIMTTEGAVVDSSGDSESSALEQCPQDIRGIASRMYDQFRNKRYRDMAEYYDEKSIMEFRRLAEPILDGSFIFPYVFSGVHKVDTSGQMKEEDDLFVFKAILVFFYENMKTDSYFVGKQYPRPPKSKNVECHIQYSESDFLNQRVRLTDEDDPALYMNFSFLKIDNEWKAVVDQAFVSFMSYYTAMLEKNRLVEAALGH